MNKNTLTRFDEILKAFRKYGFGKLLGKTTMHRYNPLKSDDDIKSLFDDDVGQRLRLMFQELGTAYIKLGQLLSTRPDIVGNKISKELKKLQDNNPSEDFKEIKKLIEEELEKPLDEVFELFNEEALATASIGQVHEAFLKNGDWVAVKVQKSNVEETIDTDLTIMKFIASEADRFNSKLKAYNLPGIVDEFERSIMKEIDYYHEMMNIKRLEDNFKFDKTIHIPKVYPEYSSKRILTMEFINGDKLADVFGRDDSKFDKKLIARRVVKSYFKQIFVDGFFHADPHPGNIIILENNVVCFIDEGMMGILDDEFKSNLAELMVYFADQNIEALLNQLIYMDILTEKTDIKNLKRDVTDLFSRYYGVELSHFDGVIDDLLAVMQKYDVKLPNEFVLMARGLAMVESIGQALDPSIDVFEILQPVAKKVIRKKYSPKTLAKNAKEDIFAIEHMAKNLPKIITRTFYKIEEGELQINFEIGELNNVTNKLSLALIISALLIGSSMVMTINKGPMLFDLPILGFIGFVISLILGIFTVLKYMVGN